MQQLRYEWSLKSASERKIEKDWLYELCVKTGNPNSIECQEWNNINAEDTWTNTVSGTKDFDGILRNLGIGQNLHFRDTMYNPNDPGNASLLREGVQEADKQFRGKKITLKQDGKTVEIDAMAFIDYMNMGKDPTHTIKEFLKEHGMEDKEFISTQMGGAVVMSTDAYEKLNRLFDNYISAVKRPFNDPKFTDVQQTPAIAIRDPKKRSALTTDIKKHIGEFIYRDKKGRPLTAHFTNAVVKALQGEAVNWGSLGKTGGFLGMFEKNVGLEGVVEGEIRSVPMVHVILPNNTSEVGLQLDFGGGAIINMFPHDGGNTVAQFISDIGLTSISPNSPYVDKLVTPIARKYENLVREYGHNGKLYTKFGDMNIALSSNGGEYIAEILDGNRRPTGKTASDASMNILVSALHAIMNSKTEQ